MKRIVKTKKKKDSIYECAECGLTVAKPKSCCGKPMKKSVR